MFVERRTTDPRASHRGRGRATYGAAQGDRFGHRDATMVLAASELVDLRWEQWTSERPPFGRPVAGGDDSSPIV
jgi:hypothetical protein